MNLRIYNRWGKEIYHDTHYQNNWSAEDVAEGMYYYTFHYEGCEPQKSWLQVIK